MPQIMTTVIASVQPGETSSGLLGCALEEVRADLRQLGFHPSQACKRTLSGWTIPEVDDRIPKGHVGYRVALDQSDIDEIRELPHLKHWIFS